MCLQEQQEKAGDSEEEDESDEDDEDDDDEHEVGGLPVFDPRREHRWYCPWVSHCDDPERLGTQISAVHTQRRPSMSATHGVSHSSSRGSAHAIA